MPVVLIRTGPDRTRNALWLVNRVLMNREARTVTTIEGDSVATEAQQALEALNEAEQELMIRAGFRHCHTDWYDDLAPEVQDYDEPVGFDGIVSDPRIDDWQLSPLTPDTFDARYPSVQDYGLPNYYTLTGGKVKVYPVPDDAALRERYVYDDLLWYVCTKRHTAGADHVRPSEGNEDDWALTEVVPGETADYAWASGKSYKSGRMVMRYQKGLTILAADVDIPTLPARFYYPLLAGAQYLLSLSLPTSVDVRDDLRRRWEKWLYNMEISGPGAGESPPMVDPRPL